MNMKLSCHKKLKLKGSSTLLPLCKLMLLLRNHYSSYNMRENKNVHKTIHIILAS